jgi:hypothetical protein
MTEPSRNKTERQKDKKTEIVNCIKHENKK